VVLKLAGEATDNRSKVKSEASRFFFVRQLFFVKLNFFVTRLFFDVRKLFFVARFFFVTGTIAPIPIACVPIFLWKAA